jgi:tetratricopeptide (TPR) repeat protein
VRFSGGLSDSLRGCAYQSAGSFAYRQQELARADEWFRLALSAREGADDSSDRGWILRSLSQLAELRGDEHEADALSEQAAAIFAELEDRWSEFNVSHDRAYFALRRNDHERARALLEECVVWAREHSDEFDLGAVLIDLGILELREEHYAEAVRAFAESLECGVRRGLRVHIAASLRGLAVTEAARGELQPAARMLGAADRMDEEIGRTREPYEQEAVADTVGIVLDRAEEPEIAMALAEGRAMSDAEVAAYALATVGKRVAS